MTAGTTTTTFTKTTSTTTGMITFKTSRAESPHKITAVPFGYKSNTYRIIGSGVIIKQCSDGSVVALDKLINDQFVELTEVEKRECIEMGFSIRENVPTTSKTDYVPIDQGISQEIMKRFISDMTYPDPKGEMCDVDVFKKRLREYLKFYNSSIFRSSEKFQWEHAMSAFRGIYAVDMDLILDIKWKPRMKLVGTIEKFIDDFIGHATHHLGTVYGGFVRDYLIPKKYGDGPRPFGDIDIWFKDYETMESFVADVQNHTEAILIQFTDVPCKQAVGVYPSDVVRMHVSHKYLPHRTLFDLDLVISPDFFPVCDFDINCMTYNGKFKVEQPNNMYFEMIGGSRVIGSYDKRINDIEVLDNILEKRLNVFPNFKCKDRINDFEARGWKINYLDW